MKAFGWLRINCDNGTMPKIEIIKEESRIVCGCTRNSLSQLQL